MNNKPNQPRRFRLPDPIVPGSRQIKCRTCSEQIYVQNFYRYNAANHKPHQCFATAPKYKQFSATEIDALEREKGLRP